MECPECDSIIHDFMHAEVANEQARTQAFDHIVHCARCEARFSTVRSLERALRTLAEAMDTERSAAELEPVLRSVFQQQKIVRQRSRSVASWLAIGVAASLLLSIGLVSRHLIFGPERKPQILATPKPVQPARMSNAQIPEPAAKLAQETHKHRSSRPRVSEQRMNAEELVTGFYALPYAENSDHLMSGEIVRVKLQGSALPGIGFPMALNGDRAAEQFTADLIVGENGLPLAIRFVR
jgi:plasmid stabilization system protein ParE